MERAEKIKFLKSLIFPLIFLFFLWSIRLFEEYFLVSFNHLGVLPLTLKGLIGIVTAPLVHADFNHLISNTFALFFLTLALFYFYRSIAVWAFVSIYVLSGFWVWFFGREAFHIGASGLVYGLVSFLFFSGVFRKYVPLIALSLAVVFLYGGIIWGIFPLHASISWETHLTGLLAGIIMAVYFKKEGPQKPKYSWEEEEEDEDEDLGSDEAHEGNSHSAPPVDIKYHYKP